MIIENMLREQFTDTAVDISLVGDLVPGVLREGRRRQAVRRGGLIAATVSASVLATATYALVTPSAADVSQTTVAPAASPVPDAFATQIRTVLTQLFPGTSVTVRRLPHPPADPRTKVLPQTEKPALAADYAITLTTSSGTVDGDLAFFIQASGQEDASCAVFESYHSDVITPKGCLQAARADGSEVWALDTQGYKRPVDPATGLPYGSAQIPSRWFVAGFDYHGVRWGLELEGGAHEPPAGITLRQLLDAGKDMRLATLIDAWKAAPHSEDD